MPELFYRLDREVVTPCIPWAKPYYQTKKLKILVVAPRWSQRDTVELELRMDATCDAVFLDRPGDSGEGFEPKEVTEALKRGHDVIILSTFDTGKMPAAVLDGLLGEVHRGAGLIYLHGNFPKERNFMQAYREAYSEDFVRRLKRNPWYPVDGVQGPGTGRAAGLDAPGADDEDEDFVDRMLDGSDSLPPQKQYLAEAFPFDALSAFGVREEKRVNGVNGLVKLYRLGKGNILFLKNWEQTVSYGETGETKFPGGHLVRSKADTLQYEYYFSFLIKCVLWAARCTPNVRFRDFPTQVTGDDLHFALAKTDGDWPPDLSVDLNVRTSGEMFRKPDRPLIRNGLQRAANSLTPLHRVTRKLVPLQKTASVSIEIPKLPAGTYFVEVLLKSAGRHLNWGVGGRTVSHDFLLSAIASQPDVLDFEKGNRQQLETCFSFSAPSPKNATLDMALYDNYDRKLWEESVAIPEGASEHRQSISLEAVCDIKSSLLKLRGQLSRDGHPVSVKVGYLTTVNRPYPFFTMSAWGGPGRDRDTRHRFRVVADLGFEILRGGGVDTMKVADMRFDSGFLTLNRHSSAVEKLEYGDPGWRRRVRELVAGAGARTRRLDCFSFILGGDEPDFPMAFGGPFYAFRAYLNNVYGEVAELNRSWGAAFSCFEEIKEDRYRPDNWGKLQEECRESGRFAPIIDYKMFQYWMVADLFRLVKGTLRENSPKARLAITTLMWNHGFRGYFFPEMLKHVDFYSPYLSCSGIGDITQSEAGRSFLSDGAIFGMLAGAYDSTMTGPAGYYHVIPHSNLLGGGRNFYWYSFGDVGETGLSPCMTPYPQTVMAARELNWMKDGPAQLVLRSKRRQPEVAVLYSQESFVFAYHGYGGSRVQWRQNKILHGLKSLGFSTRFVTEEAICRGRLNGYRALYLPVSQCISLEAAAGIKEFVKDGGLLIGDVRPGVADQHGNVYDDPPLAEVFGVRWRLPLSLMQGIAFSPERDDRSIPPYRIVGEFSGVEFADPTAKQRGIGHYDPNLELAGATAALFRGRFAKPDFVPPFKRAISEAEEALARANSPKSREGIEKKLRNLKDNLRVLEQILKRQDTAPLMMHHRYGKGHAVLLGMSVCNGLPDVHLLDAIFKGCGVGPIVEFLKGEDGFSPSGFCTGFECGGFEDGQTRYYGFTCTRNTEPHRARIRTRLTPPGHVYDLRQGRYLGHQDEIVDEFGNHWAAWYAVLPYKVEGIEAKLDDSPISPGEAITGTVACMTSTGTAGRHVINVKVLQDGQEVQYLTQNIEAKNGRCAFRIATASNDQVKSWTLQFRDVATGAMSRIKL